MLAIIDYKAGNTQSLINAIKRIGGVEYLLTNNPEQIKIADKVILPGVGRASQCMNELDKLGLIDVIKNIKVPFLGICVGMQLLFEYSEEDDTTCLGIIPGNVKKFTSDTLAIPHMGWNTITATTTDPILANIKKENFVYYVHSFAAEINQYTIAASNYTTDFCGIVRKDNFWGTQFHPEKSASIGAQILENFCMMDQSVAAVKPQCSVAQSNNLTKRIIACMDIKNNRVVKGINFTDIKDAGDPVTLGKLYSEHGADELVFLDITATYEGRENTYDLVKKIASQINIPFCIGGGIRKLEHIRTLLKCGADKVSIGSAAVKNPDFVREASMEFGDQCIVISVDPKWNEDKQIWEIYIKGGRENTGIDAIKFSKQMESLGAGELLVNSLDRDGMKTGYDIKLLKAIKDAVTIPVIASSGAGKKEDFLEAFTQAHSDAALAASLFHYRELEISDLKDYLNKEGIATRKI
jgi:cyclase